MMGAEGFHLLNISPGGSLVLPCYSDLNERGFFHVRDSSLRVKLNLMLYLFSMLGFAEVVASFLKSNPGFAASTGEIQRG